MGSCSLLQGIFPTQGLNPGLLHCRRILYHMSHKGSPRYWSGYPIPSLADLPNPGIELAPSALQKDSLPTERPGKPLRGTVTHPNMRTHRAQILEKYDSQINALCYLDTVPFRVLFFHMHHFKKLIIHFLAALGLRVSFLWLRQATSALWLWRVGFSLRWLLVFRGTGFTGSRLGTCGTQA